MRGLWIERGNITLRQDLNLDTSARGLEVKVKRAGICGTDMELLRGYYDFVGVPGHEFVGEVVTEGVWLGKRVVADINFACGACDFCDQGDGHHCNQRRTLGIREASGAFAERIKVPEENLIEVPAQVPDHHAMFAEPLAAALQILQQVDLHGQRVLLVGAGRLGRLVAWVINCLVPSASLTIALRTPERSKQLPQGVDCVPPEHIQKTYDVAIDCTGNSQGFALALMGLKAKGTLVIKSTYADRLSVDMGQVVVNEITIVGSRCGPVPQAIEFIATHPEVFDTVVLRDYAIDDYNEAFRSASMPSVDKVSFQF